MDLKRSYEVSIWTLQDEFITVLKPLNVENIGQLESKELQLNTDDGVNQYSCSIPMYLYQGAERIENPIWYNTTNGNIIANMRKIKVILNKGAVDNDDNPIEQVYEFLIIKVDERHEKDQVFCDITCEDLAYNELGKIGYKISLSSDKFLDEYNKWHEEHEEDEEEPVATLQYWLDQFLEYKEPDDDSGYATQWYYNIQMNWDAYGYATERAKNRVYEEEYVSSWGHQINETTGEEKLVPVGTETYKEKARLVDLEESNIFNLTQELAEKFGVFVRYEFKYDDNYHIVGRRIIFYNNYLREQDGYLDITYPYHAASIKREIDGTDITTKMFVRPVDADSADAGVITIMDVGANKSKEDYIMNFEYMREIGAITAEQYAEIPKYEIKMHVYNEQLQHLSAALEVLTDEENDLKARKTLLENAIALDKERINEAEDLLNSLDAKDLHIDSTISITADNPRTAVLLEQDETPNKYFINISEGGVLRETLKIYREYSYTSAVNEGRPGLDVELTGTFVEDEAGDLIRVENIIVPNKTHSMVYLTYDYRPALKYDQVRQLWTARQNKDETDLANVEAELEAKTALIEAKTEAYNDLLAEKKEEIARFERMMGPALRESYWQPDDYKTTGDNFDDVLTMTNGNAGASTYTTFVWDTELFDDEQKGYYNVSVNENPVYYPCIALTGTALQYIQDHYNEGISILFYDFIAGALEQDKYVPKNLRSYSLGSQAQLCYIQNNNSAIPAIILTGAESASNFTMRNLIAERNKEGMRVSPLIGVLETRINGEAVEQIITSSTTVSWYNLSSTDEDGIPSWGEITVCYPRVRINSMLLKKDETFVVHYGTDLLKNYEDYYLLTRSEAINPDAAEDEKEYTGYNYLTLKPEALIPKTASNIDVAFTLSNANTVIYLDAVQVLKENSMPKVTYTIDPSFINRDFHYRLYEQLNRIVNVNDLDLKLENVQGYISGLTLDLDNPFNDKIEIKNYRNKFEDLFSSIVAQTESMKKNAFTVGLAAAALTPSGGITPAAIQQSINRADLDYAFNQGTLTIDEENGIWATSDDGVVAIRGGGIFTATDKDDDDNWIWNTGILPQGINADLITTGQLDTNLIRIYAGDKLRFQMNGDGLFAYKSIFEDPDLLPLLYSGAFAGDMSEEEKTQIINLIESHGYLDTKQYVVHNENGLFLTAEVGAIIKDENNKLKLINENIDRVEISWDGLKLRDWNGDPTLSADPDTGDLTLKGHVQALSFVVATENTETQQIEWVPIEHYAGIKEVVVQYQQIASDDKADLIEANWAASVDNIDNTKYLWSRTKTVISGQAPSYTEPVCIAYPSIDISTAALISLDGPQYFIKNGNIITPQSIVLTATVQNCQIEGWYIDGSTTPYVADGEEHAYTGNTFTITPGDWELKTITVKADNNLQDTRSIAILIKGSDGSSPISAYLTNDNISFLVDEDGKIIETTDVPTTLYVYEGATPLTDYTVEVSGAIANQLIYTVSGNLYTIRAVANQALNDLRNGALTFTIKKNNEIIAITQLNWLKVQSGTSPTLYDIVVSDSVIVESEEHEYSPAYITLSALMQVGSGVKQAYENGYYKVINITTGSEIALIDNKYTIPNGTTGLQCYLYTDSSRTNLVDQQTVPVLSEGAQGPAGQDGYTVLLSNESHVFPGEITTAVVNVATTSEIMVFKGASRIYTYTVGTISPPSGIIFEWENNDNRIFRVTTGSNLTSGGIINIPISIIDGPTITKTFTYSISFKGGQGDPGRNVANILLYQRAATEPQPPTNVIYTFATSTAAGTLGDWSQSLEDVVDDGNPCWIASATANSTATTDTINDNEWEVIKWVEDGSSGSPGLNTATIYMYKRAATAPSNTDKPGTATYTFDTHTLSFNSESDKNGWSETIPAGVNPCYITTAVAVSSTNTDTITGWSTSVLLVQNGEKGADADQLLSVEQQYYLSTSNSSVVGGDWSSSIPEYQTGRYYWTRTKMTWDRTTDQITYTEPVLAAGLNQLNIRTNSALAAAEEAAQAVAPITTNGLSSGVWNGVDYGLILGNTSTSKPMLIGSNSGITMAANTSDPSAGAAMVMDKDGIAMYGTSIDFKAAEGDVTSTVVINPTGIALNTGTFTIESGNFSISDTGDVEMTGKVTAESGEIGGWNIRQHQLDSGTTTTFVALNSDPNSTYAIWAGDPTAADAPFRVERDGSVIATDGQIGGWNLGDKLLYSGTDADSTYVGLDSDPNHTYAIWAGDETAADAPFRVARDGTVYLTKLKAVDEQGHTTNVNLTNYPFWKLNTNFLRSASVSGNQLTLTYFNGDTVNFSKANAYDHATVGFGEEVYGGFRAEITLYNDNNEVIITPSVTATEHNDGHYITVIAVADGESAQTRLDLQRWYNEGWTNAYNQIVTPSSGSGTSNNIYLPNATPDGDPVNNALTLRLHNTTPSAATVTMHWRGSTQIGEIDVSPVYTSGITAGENGVDFSDTVYLWTNGSKTIELTNGKSTSVTIPDPLTPWSSTYLSSVGTYGSYNASTTIGGKAISTGNISAEGAYKRGYDAVTASWGGNWANGSTTVTVSAKTTGTSRDVTVTMPTSATITGTLSTDTSYEISCVVGGQTYTDTIDTTDSFNAGKESVGFDSMGTWASGSRTITLTNGVSDTVSMPSTGTVTGTFRTGTNAQYDLKCTPTGGPTYTGSLNATKAYENGATYGASTVTVTSIAASGGYITAKASNNAEKTIAMPAASSSSVSGYFDGTHDTCYVTATIVVGGKTYTATGTIT